MIRARGVPKACKASLDGYLRLFSDYQSVYCSIGSSWHIFMESVDKDCLCIDGG